MRMRAVVGALCAALVLAAPGVAAAQASQRVPADAATTAQKAAFIENLLNRSVAARTMDNSGEQSSKAKLDEARALVDEAKALIDDGQYKNADAKLDEALAVINSETRRLSKAQVNSEHGKELYEKQLHAVELFLQAYERVSAERGSGAATKAQVGDIKELMGKAQGLADGGDYDGARAVLADAYQIARGDIRSMRQGQTLTRSLNFATREEEYDYERGRNDSHFMLLKFARSNNSPAPSMVDRINQYESDARAVRERAEKSASGGNFETAINDLNESTDMLLKAIRMSGIFVPG